MKFANELRKESAAAKKRAGKFVSRVSLSQRPPKPNSEVIQTLMIVWSRMP